MILLVEVAIYLIFAVVFITKSSLIMIEKKRIFSFMPWFVIGVVYCFVAGLIFYGVSDNADDIVLAGRLTTFILISFIIWRRKWD